MTELEQARQAAAESRAAFLKHYREACIAFGNYCQEMEKAQALTSASADPKLGVFPETQNKIRELLITELPHKQLLREGFDCFMGWGWNHSYQVIPLVSRQQPQGEQSE
jgi:hypothetical protein